MKHATVDDEAVVVDKANDPGGRPLNAFVPVGRGPQTVIIKDDDPYLKDVCETIKIQLEPAEEDAKPCDESKFEAADVVFPQ